MLFCHLNDYNDYHSCCHHIQRKGVRMVLVNGDDDQQDDHEDHDIVHDHEDDKANIQFVTPKKTEIHTLEKGVNLEAA